MPPLGSWRPWQRNGGWDPAVWYDDRPLGGLSGGEKIRLQLALLDLQRPTLLLLDEPSNDLDADALAALEDYLLDSPVPVLYVSHDETLLSRTANVLIHLELVRRKTEPRYTVARQSYDAYTAQRQASLEHQVQMAEQEERDHRKQMEKYQQIYQRVDHEQRVITRANPGGGRLLKKKMKALLSQGRRLEREYEQRTRLPDVEEAILAGFDPSVILPPGKAVLELDLPVLSVGDRELARNIRLRVMGGEKIGLTGANGAEKPLCSAILPGCCCPGGISGPVICPRITPNGWRRTAHRQNIWPLVCNSRAARGVGPSMPYQGPHLSGQPQIHPGGDGASGVGAVGGTEGQAAAASADPGKGRRAAAG